MKSKSGVLKWIVGILALLVPLMGLTVWRFLRMMMSDDPAIWAKEIASFQKQDRENPPSQGVILFTGSSSIRFWQTLEQDMAPLHVMNRGFGGAKIKQVTYYADTETDNLLHFIDMTDKILGPDGRPRRDLFKWDRFHPNERGYAIWTASIKPILEAALFRSQRVAQG